MGQRKLTTYEQQLVYEAWNAIGRLNSQLIPEIYSRLSGMRDHGTTDGKPYVEPQPEIGDGYRVATDADSPRRDLEAWNPSSKKWEPGFIVGDDATYRVPIDRIPTDDDARQRPLVMVRDIESEKWWKATLLYVASRGRKFVVADDEVASPWRYCRFPYPGE